MAWILLIVYLPYKVVDLNAISNRRTKQSLTIMKNARGGAHESEDVLARRARTLLIAIRTHDVPTPESGLTAEEIASARAFSPAVTSIATGMVELYELLSQRFPESDFVFENVLRKISRSWMKVYGKY